MNREQLVEQAKRYHKRSCELAWKAEGYWNEHVRVNGKLDDADYQEYRRLADESEDLCAKSNSLFDQAIKLRDPHETAESDADTEADMFATTPASEKLVIDASERTVATVERHETEEDDVLRDAVRAIEHGETTRIRAWWFGNRRGRRAALRELRELLDDMIASIDDDTEEGAR